MQERNVFWWVVCIIIIASFLRLYQLDQFPPGHYPDEAMNGNNALEALRTGDFKLYYPENNGREGLFINIQAMFLKFTGLREPWVMRLPSAIFGILTVWGTYLLGREIFSKRVGLLASFFAATSVWHIIFSRIGFRAIMAPFLLVWALYLFHLAVRLGAERRDRRWMIPALAGGLMMGLGFHTYIAYRIMPLLFLLFVPFFFRERNFWRVTALFLAATFVAGLPIGWYYLQNPADFLGRTSQVSIFTTAEPLLELAKNTGKTIAMFFVAGDFNWRHNYAGRPELFWPVAVFFLWGLVVAFGKSLKRAGAEQIQTATPDGGYGAWELFRDLRFGSLLLLAWLGLAALPVVISSEGLPHALRAILMAPAVFLLAGLGAARAYDFFRARIPEFRIFLAAVVCVLALLTFEAYQTYFLLWGSNPHTAGAFNANYVEIGRTLNSISPDVDKYVVVEAGGVDVRGYPMPTQTVMFLTDTFDPALAKAKRIHYILPAEAAGLPPNSIIFRLR